MIPSFLAQTSIASCHTFEDVDNPDDGARLTNLEAGIQ